MNARTPTWQSVQFHTAGRIVGHFFSSIDFACVYICMLWYCRFKVGLLFQIIAYATAEPLGMDSNSSQPGSRMELRRTVQNIFNEKYRKLYTRMVIIQERLHRSREVFMHPESFAFVTLCTLKLVTHSYQLFSKESK